MVVQQFLPLLILVLSFLGLWLFMKLGAVVRARQGPMDKDQRGDFNVIQGATLTLLSLIVGFSFSMALSRYDQRKHCEQIEADEVSTEYIRIALLSDGVAAEHLRGLLKKFLDERIQFYESTDQAEIERINRDTARLQDELWSEVRAEAAKQPTPLTALVVSGMTEVLNLQENTQAAWWNRIPFAAWGMMAVIALVSSAMIGNGARTPRTLRIPIFPLVIATAFFFIADLDNPYGGWIHVYPKNLVTLADSLK